MRLAETVAVLLDHIWNAYDEMNGICIFHFIQGRNTLLRTCGQPVSHPSIYNNSDLNFMVKSGNPSLPLENQHSLCSSYFHLHSSFFAGKQIIKEKICIN